MEKKTENNAENITPDLKHDNMDFAAPADGEDPLDVIEEGEEITAEELDALYVDGIDEEADALNTATTDSMIDEDNFIGEPTDTAEFEEDNE